MKLIIDQSLDNNEVEITIKCGLIDDSLEKLIQQIRLYAFSLTCKKGETSHLVRLENIYYFESVDEKTFVYCKNDVYECDMKLYELEKLLSDTSFTRINKSCILSITHIQHVRALLNAKLEAQLDNGEKVIVNRHYVQGFNNKLDLL